ncbi:F-actin-capping protein subunit beta [Paramarasmius palmivorus]|uniref:F-actin-capping protein subunit beta n=1 Tax=Paramarasmius palmivorus TaxID=297713 RepID=A0AAW0C181_9AGAR
MLVGRISGLRDGDQVCIIGLRTLSSIPLLSYDLYINILLTALFLWPLLRTGHLSQKVKRMAIRALVASVVALTTSTFNIAILAFLHGRELGWVCLGSCGADVIVNALALYWATYPRAKRQRIVTANSALGSKDLGPTRTGGLSLAARASTPFIIPPQAVRSRGELQRQDTNDPYTNPFALPRYIPKNPEPEVRITAESQTSTGKASQGIWAFVSRLLPRRPTAAGEEGQRRALEVTVTTQCTIEDEVIPLLYLCTLYARLQHFTAQKLQRRMAENEPPPIAKSGPSNPHPGLSNMADVVDSMLDLMRRLPPTRTEENVAALIGICPDYADDLLGSVDQPLQLKVDRATGREYLACDYNRDGESHRSPWSNEYDPPLEDGTIPTPKLRKLEISANEAFDTYREMYYEGGVSSVYLWDLEDGGFAGVVLLKKTMTPGSPNEPSGSWDSIHVFETAERGRQAHYKLTSTIMLQLVTKKGSEGEGDANDKKLDSNGDKKPLDGWKRDGEVTLSGSMTRQTEQDWPLHDTSSHIINTGRMIEEMEIKMRNLLQEVYFGKTRDIIYDLRSVEDLEKTRRQRELQKELVGFIKR